MCVGGDHLGQGRKVGGRVESSGERCQRGGGREGGREGREFSILTAWWRKLFLSLTVPQLRLRNFLPEGRRLKRLLEGWVESPAMLSVLRVRRVLCPVVMGVRHR